MSFDQVWEERYANGTAPGCSYSPEFQNILRDFAPLFKKGSPALELGCGDAINYFSFKAHGFDYHGIDGSSSALAAGLKRYPELDGKLGHGDFTKLQFPPMSLIMDRAAIAHNDTESVGNALRLIYNSLPKNGLFIGIDWFSATHSEFSRGIEVDAHTRTGYEDGQFKNVGNVHFSSREYLEDAFADFQIEMLRERITLIPAGYPTNVYLMPFKSKAFNGKDYFSAVWDIIARKL